MSLSMFHSVCCQFKHVILAMSPMTSLIFERKPLRLSLSEIAKLRLSLSEIAKLLLLKSTARHIFHNGFLDPCKKVGII